MAAKCQTPEPNPHLPRRGHPYRGHVGTLKHYAGLLRQITDSAFKEGEHVA